MIARLLQGYWFAVALIATCTALQALDLELALRFDRALIAEGSWWRMLSANFIHLGWNHLALNMTGAALVFALFGPGVGNLEWLAVVVLVSLVVALAVLFLDPQIHWYVGLSGTLHGMFGYGAVAELKRAPRFAVLLLLGAVAKLSWEQLFGALPGSEATVGGAIVVDAHLYGALAGALLAALKWGQSCFRAGRTR